MRYLGVIAVICVVGLTSFDVKTGIITDYHSKSILNTSSSPVGYTGAPGENGNCTACHLGTVQSSAGVIDLSFSGNNQYALGGIYTFNVSITGGMSKNGFEIVALRESDNTTVGTWLVAGSDVQVLTDTRDYVSHTSIGSSLSTWSFDWQAPSVDEGYVNFYLATNVSNGNNNLTGDLIYLDELRIASPVVLNIDNHLIDESWTVINTEGQLLVTGELFSKNNVEINLFDLSGKKIHSRVLKNQKGKVSFDAISTNELESGMYLVSIRIDKDVITKKVFI